MRFIGKDGTPGRVRRSTRDGLSFDDVANPEALTRVIRELVQKVADLEAASPREGTEFEVEVAGAADVVRLPHGYDGNVRWIVVDWAPVVGPPATVPANVPNFYRDHVNSTSNELVLLSYEAGKAVIRVEPSEYPLAL